MIDRIIFFNFNRKFKNLAVKSPQLTEQIALTLLKGVGPVKAKQLISKLNGIEPIFKSSIEEIHEVTGISKKFLFEMEREEAYLKAKKEIRFIQQKNIQPIFYLDDNYPRRLKECGDAPLLLYAKGEMNLNVNKVVSIVGTRSATEYGKGICEELIKGFIGKDILVVSGMAYGIDILIHQFCVKYNVPTIGVLGHGLDRLYPSQHLETALKMYENGGLITEFLPGTRPERENFPMRNRIVAGMSDATIVVESMEKGGSLITADLANDYNRDVFAFPGNVGQKFSKGCNQLILDQKAHLLTDTSSFLKWMHWDEQKKTENVQRTLFLNLSEEEQRIMTILQMKPHHIDSIAHLMALSVSKISVLLFNLEMNGLISSLPGKQYQIV